MPAIVTILVIVGWSLAVANGPDDGTGHDAVFWGATAVAIFVLFWFPVRKFIAWATSYFVVTSDRVIHREGWIAKRSMEIPLEAINDVVLMFASSIPCCSAPICDSSCARWEISSATPPVAAIPSAV